MKNQKAMEWFVLTMASLPELPLSLRADNERRIGENSLRTQFRRHKKSKGNCRDRKRAR